MATVRIFNTVDLEASVNLNGGDIGPLPAAFVHKENGYTLGHIDIQRENSTNPRGRFGTQNTLEIQIAQDRRRFELGIDVPQSDPLQMYVLIGRHVGGGLVVLARDGRVLKVVNSDVLEGIVDTGIHVAAEPAQGS